jgi:hypothetical protein
MVLAPTSGRGVCNPQRGDKAMGIFDKAKETLSGHSEQVEGLIEKAGDFVDEKTEGKYAEQVDQGQAMAKEQLSDLSTDQPEKPV